MTERSDIHKSSFVNSGFAGLGIKGLKNKINKLK